MFSSMIVMNPVEPRRSVIVRSSFMSSLSAAPVRMVRSLRIDLQLSLPLLLVQDAHGKCLTVHMLCNDGQRPECLGGGLEREGRMLCSSEILLRSMNGFIRSRSTTLK